MLGYGSGPKSVEQSCMTCLRNSRPVKSTENRRNRKTWTTKIRKRKLLTLFLSSSFVYPLSALAPYLFQDGHKYIYMYVCRRISKYFIHGIWVWVWLMPIKSAYWMGLTQFCFALVWTITVHIHDWCVNQSSWILWNFLRLRVLINWLK